MQNEAGQRLIEFCQENALVITNTLFPQHKIRLYTWTSPDGQHWNQIDYILCSQRWRSSIQLAKTRPGADCGSDHELLIAKFTVKLKKVEKTTRPFRYDLNKIPLNYTVGVANRFKGLDLECLTNYGLKFVTLFRRQGSGHPQGKEVQKSKVAVWGGLTNRWERREVKSKGIKERCTHLNVEFQRIARRDKKAFLSDQCKQREENNRMGKTWNLFKKIRDTKGNFMQRWAQ